MEAINSAVGKLAEVIRNYPDDLPQDLKSLIGDLTEITDLTDKQVKVWVKQFQELRYELEDWCLDPQASTYSSSGESDGRACQISEFRDRIKEAHERYESDITISASSKAEGTTDSLLLWGRRAVVVGIDGPKKALARNYLNNKDKKLVAVVSILGVGGLGKTTLGKEIYGDLKAQFDCQASVFLSQIPSLKLILLDILNQVTRQKGIARTELDEREVIAEIREFLGNKRYLILVDDIQSTWAWKIISCAFPENDCGSRILVTTRSNDVAELCSMCPSDVVYKMEALSLENSKELLGNLIGIPKKNRPTDFEEVCDRVFKLCCGIPLAIIVTAGLLSWHWLLHGKCNFPLLGQTYSKPVSMRKILDICFADLSHHVKYCFLFLSSFPLNYTINKDHLLRRWVTEGLVKEGNGKGLWETGESYFNELVHRRLIAPVFDYNDDQAVGCTINGVVYDFITSLAREDNFVTDASELVRGPFPCDTIRRYSVHYIGQKDEADTLVTSTMHLSRVRYLTVFGEGRVPYDSLSAIKLLRVLDLKNTNSFTKEAWRFIQRLSLLQYLALGGVADSRISKEEAVEINVDGLIHLETLDVSRIPIAKFDYREISARNYIYTLPKLVSIIGDTVELPRSERPRFINWKEAATISIETDAQYYVVAELLVKSMCLKKLGVSAGSYFKYNSSKIMPFFTVLGKCKAQCLLLDCDRVPKGWTPSPSLQRFVLKKSISSVPDTWTSLVNLTHLDVQISEVGAQDILYIGMLPKLMFLKLCSEGYDPKGRVLIFGGFQSLKVAWFKCPNGGMGLQFGDWNTMPDLRRLHLDFSERETRVLYGRSFDFGLRFPKGLIEVNITINCKGSSPWDVSDAESAIKEQLSDHINNPRFQFRREGENPSNNAAAVASSSEASTSKK